MNAKTFHKLKRGTPVWVVTKNNIKRVLFTGPANNRDRPGFYTRGWGCFYYSAEVFLTAKEAAEILLAATELKLIKVRKQLAPFLLGISTED